MKKSILPLCLLTLLLLSVDSSKLYAQTTGWKLSGNAGINPNTQYIGTRDNQPLIFRTNATERMRIQGAKIGMGTKKPDSKLHVVGTGYVSLSSPGYLILGDTKGYNMAMDVNVIQARYNGSGSSLYLNYYGGYTFLGVSGLVAINTNGNLTTSYPAGINGSYNSSFALNVNATSSYNGINVTDGGNALAFNAIKSGSYAGIYMEKTSTASYDACVWGNSKGLSTGVQGNSATGIGVYGITGNSSNYAGFFVGSVYTSGVYQSSDLALKKDIQDLTKATDIINQLRPKIYQYKEDGNFKLMNLPKGERYGLIAEDVEKVLPGLVKQTRFETATDEDIENGRSGAAIDFKALNYIELIPIMIKGMQEQQAVIKHQQEQINQLKELLHEIIASNSIDAKIAEVATSGYLIQNAPNPFSENTVVKCFVPSSVKQAELAVYNMKGQLIKLYKLSGGMNNVNIIAGSLASGQYTYSLLADGKKIDTKNMVMTN